jgi:hypothetical protein
MRVGIDLQDRLWPLFSPRTPFFGLVPTPLKGGQGQDNVEASLLAMGRTGVWRAHERSACALVKGLWHVRRVLSSSL